jgi:predicted nucleic acid-binding protein
VDADILIWHLRGKEIAWNFLKSLQDQKEYELWTGAMQRAEIVFFMHPNEETQTLQLLSLFQTASVDQRIVDTAGQLYRDWHPSHGVDANDLLLAATAMTTGGKIYTLNTKYYPMPNIVIEKAWG